MPMRREVVPVLTLPLPGGGTFDLAEESGERGTLICFHRGFVRADGTLHCGVTQTMPFARPRFGELVAASDFAKKNDDPARGGYAGPV